MGIGDRPSRSLHDTKGRERTHTQTINKRAHDVLQLRDLTNEEVAKVRRFLEILLR